MLLKCPNDIYRYVRKFIYLLSYINLKLNLSYYIWKWNRFFVDPNDERTKSNMNYYIRELKELKAKIAGDNPNALQENVRDPFAFKNERPEHVLGRERDEYEALCRGDAPPVYNNYNSSKI